MSNQARHGGPAFPSEGEGHGNPRYHSPGMSLRDYFAGQALAGVVANPETPNQMIKLGFDESKELVAKWAYAVADAMLKAREAD